MEFKKTDLYSLICSKANFDMLRKAEQLSVLCYVRYYLENDMVGDAINVYNTLEKSYPAGIETDQIPLTIQEVRSITADDIYTMPWSYIHLLETLASCDSEDGEITTETVLNDIITSVTKGWHIPRPSNVSMKDSFSYTYDTFMKDTWIHDFVELMNIVWPLTSAARLIDTNSVNEEEVIDIQLPENDYTPNVESIKDDMSTSLDKPFTNAHLIKSLPKNIIEKNWPYMRVKNMISHINKYKLTSANRCSLRISHYDGLNFLATYAKIDLDTLIHMKSDNYKCSYGIDKIYVY
jgi:hypothetical protein